MNLKKSVFQVSIINTISTGLGFAFHIFLGRHFGISWELDCLFIALLIFSFFGIFNNFITSLLIPVFNEIKNKDEKDAFEFADVIFKLSLLIGVIIWFSVLNFSPVIINLFASGFDERSAELSASLLKIVFWGYIFNNLTVSISGILNAGYLFFVPVFSGLLLPILNFAALFILVPEYGVKGIAISYAVSNTLQAVISISYLFIKTPWRPTLKIYHNKLPKLIMLSSKAVIANFVWSLREVISRNIASHLGSGAIALLSYAEKIINILFQIIISPVSSVFYSKVSELIALSKWRDVQLITVKMLQINIAIVFFVSAAVVVFLMPFFGTLFIGSKFTMNDIRMIWFITMIELISLIAMALAISFVRIINAAKHLDIALFYSPVCVILFYILASILSRFFGLYGIALSISIIDIVAYILISYFTNRFIIKIEQKIILYKIIKNSIIAGFFIIIGISGNIVLKENILILFLWSPVWLFLYFVSSKYFLKDEWEVIKG